MVLSTPRFLFFDLGVRHAAAALTNSPDTVLAHPGPIFEHWVGQELHRRIALNGRGKLMYLRIKGGMEIDYLVDTGDEVIPIEVKTAHPTGVRRLSLRAAVVRRESRLVHEIPFSSRRRPGCAPSASPRRPARRASPPTACTPPARSAP